MIHHVECGCGDVVTLDKLFGPTIFCELRIRPHLPSLKWIVEKKVHSEIDPVFQWVRVAEIDAQ